MEVYVHGMEIIEKQCHGFGVIMNNKDHEYSTNYYPGFFRNYFLA